MRCSHLIGSTLVLAGAAAIFFPAGLVSTTATSYNTNDLVRGWGLYATALGLVAIYPPRLFAVLAACFAVSIAWHLQIVYRQGTTRPRGWTAHHENSIWANGAALAFVLICHYRHAK